MSKLNLLLEGLRTGMVLVLEGRSKSPTTVHAAKKLASHVKANAGKLSPVELLDGKPGVHVSSVRSVGNLGFSAFDVVFAQDVLSSRPKRLNQRKLKADLERVLSKVAPKDVQVAVDYMGKPELRGIGHLFAGGVHLSVRVQRPKAKTT